MANETQPYGIGSDIWPGLAKLMEEMGELQQVLGKVMACSGTDAIYWDGSSLVPQLIEEMGDVRAAMIFFCEVNGISKALVHERADKKLEKFRYWHEHSRERGLTSEQLLERFPSLTRKLGAAELDPGADPGFE